MKGDSHRGETGDKQRRDLVILWVFFLVWAGSALGAFYLFAIHLSSLTGALITGPMALFGLYLMWRMVRVTTDDIKFGVVSLTTSPRPARAGGRLEAVLRFRDRAPGVSVIDAELRCVEVTISSQSRTGTSPVEQVAWSSRKTISLRHDRADIAFDVPADAPATDLPGERRNETGWHTLPMAPGKALRFHRWEVFVTARTPGLDLERSFPVVIDPKGSGAAAGMKTATPTHVPVRTLPGKIPAILIGVAILAGVLVNLASNVVKPEKPAGEMAAVPPAPAAQPPVQVRELPSQTPWTRDTRGWTLPLPAFSRYIGVAADGIRSTRENASERIVFDRILIEMNPAWSHMEYFDVMISVSYFPADPNVAGTVGGFSTRLGDVRGNLTAEAPVHQPRDLSVVVPRPQVAIGRTELRLGINANIREPSSRFRYTHETSRTFIRHEK